MENTAPMENRIPSRIAENVLMWGEEVMLALVTIVLVFSFCFRVVTVSGTSMSPNYNDGDRVVLLPAFSAEAGDVVVVHNTLGQPVIKRVIATAGQTVDFDEVNHMVLVDGYPLDESRFGLRNGVTVPPYSSFELLRFPQTVPEGCVFLLGDNRAVSEDSRYEVVGMVDKRSVLGKVAFRLLPGTLFQ